MLIRMVRNKRGQGMAEYALIIAVVAIGAISILSNFKGKLSQTFGTLGSKLVSAS